MKLQSILKVPYGFIARMLTRKASNSPSAPIDIAQLETEIFNLQILFAAASQDRKALKAYEKERNRIQKSFHLSDQQMKAAVRRLSDLEHAMALRAHVQQAIELHTQKNSSSEAARVQWLANNVIYGFSDDEMRQAGMIIMSEKKAKQDTDVLIPANVTFVLEPQSDVERMAAQDSETLEIPEFLRRGPKDDFKGQKDVGTKRTAQFRADPSDRPGKTKSKVTGKVSEGVNFGIKTGPFVFWSATGTVAAGLVTVGWLIYSSINSINSINAVETKGPDTPSVEAKGPEKPGIEPSSSFNFLPSLPDSLTSLPQKVKEIGVSVLSRGIATINDFNSSPAVEPMVEASVDVPTLILRKTPNAGRNLIRVNGQPVSVPYRAIVGKIGAPKNGHQLIQILDGEFKGMEGFVGIQYLKEKLPNSPQAPAAEKPPEKKPEPPVAKPKPDSRAKKLPDDKKQSSVYPQEPTRDNAAINRIVIKGLDSR